MVLRFRLSSRRRYPLHGEDLFAVTELDMMILEETALTEKSHADRIHPLSEASVGLKDNPVAHVDFEVCVIGSVGLRPDTTCHRFGQVEDVELQHDGEREWKEASVST